MGGAVPGRALSKDGAGAGTNHNVATVCLSAVPRAFRARPGGFLFASSRPGRSPQSRMPGSPMPASPPGRTARPGPGRAVRPRRAGRLCASRHHRGGGCGKKLPAFAFLALLSPATASSQPARCPRRAPGRSRASHRRPTNGCEPDQPARTAARRPETLPSLLAACPRASSSWPRTTVKASAPGLGFRPMVTSCATQPGLRLVPLAVPGSDRR